MRTSRALLLYILLLSQSVTEWLPSSPSFFFFSSNNSNLYIHGEFQIRNVNLGRRRRKKLRQLLQVFIFFLIRRSLSVAQEDRKSAEWKNRICFSYVGVGLVKLLSKLLSYKHTHLYLNWAAEERTAQFARQLTLENRQKLILRKDIHQKVLRVIIMWICRFRVTTWLA